MLHVPPLGCDRLDDDGADGDSGQWTGEKRRKHLPSDTGEVADAARIISSSSATPGDKEEVPAYTKHEEAPEDPVSDEEFLIIEDILSERRAVLVSCGELDLEPQREVYKRLVLYRMRAHKLSKGQSKDNLLGDDDALPAFLDEHAASLVDLHFLVNCYFRHLEQQEGAGTIDWYFLTRCKFEDYSGDEDYARLVLKNYLPDVGYVWQNWEKYRTIFTTYEMDKDYVKFVEEMSSKLQWLKLYFDYPETSDVWSDVHRRGARQAFKVATRYPHMNFVLAYTAYEEFIWSSRREYVHCKDKDCLFFEIRKRCVTDRQLTFEAALMELLRENLFSRHQDLMMYALQKDSYSDLEEQYRSCVEGIPGNASEDVARAFIRAAVWKLRKVNKRLHEYMTRKMEIAESIGLVNCPT